MAICTHACRTVLHHVLLHHFFSRLLGSRNGHRHNELADHSISCNHSPQTNMAPHLTSAELDWLQRQKSKAPLELHALLEARRAKKGMAAPDITNLRKALKGLTYRRGGPETRGRKKSLTKANVRTMNKVRKQMLKCKLYL